MEQHPIPQNISSYEFRLVGDMTLKQFLQLAGGIIVGVIIYRLPLPGFVRYPFVFLSVVIGIALAFVPINGRPFARYIFAFITAIYAPTEFIWRQAIKNPPPVPGVAPITNPVPINPPAPAEIVTPIELEHPVANSAPLISNDSTSPTTSNSTQTTTAQIDSPPITPPAPLPSPEVMDLPVQTSSSQFTPIDDQTIFSSSQSPTPVEAAKVLNTPKKFDVDPGVLANITQLITAPTQKNILSGIVVTPEGNTIENAIVEIIDSKTGIPARALRTNRTGQFQIATPLSLGSYIIQTEKENTTFSPVHIEVKDNIIDPIIITSA